MAEIFNLLNFGKKRKEKRNIEVFKIKIWKLKKKKEKRVIEVKLKLKNG